MIIVMDISINFVIKRVPWLDEPIDIQTPEILYSKIKALESYSGKKVVILGNSVVLGESMKEHGDAKWRRHSISHVLLEQLKAKYPGQSFRVMNMGLNGSIPADWVKIVDLLKNADIDLLIISLDIRSFSMDFSTDNTEFTRPWLKNIEISPYGHLLRRGAESFSEMVENKFYEVAVNHWALYRLKSFFIWRLLNETPQQLTLDIRTKLNHKLSVKHDARPALVSESDILLLKIKKRYDNIQLSDNNRQIIALKRLVNELTEKQQNTLFYYASENPEILPQLIDNSTYQKIKITLASIIKQGGSPLIQYVSPTERLDAHYYDDYAHMNAKGYKVFVSDILLPAVLLSLTRDKNETLHA